MDTKARTAIAHNVKALRLRAKLSQAKLAKQSGVAQTAISYIERLDTKSPTIESLESLARVFRVPVWTLMMDFNGLTEHEIREFAALCEEFMRLPPESRREVLRTAERERRYCATNGDRSPALV